MRVKDLMTTDVLTVQTSTLLKDAAALLAQHRISGIPVVDDERHVLGVLSEGDILYKESDTSGRPSLLERLLAPGTGAIELKLAARTVGQAMSAPALTTGPRRPVTEAATMMIEEGVNRLPVVDHNERLMGIVTRADLVRAFVRPDEAIEREIREDVIHRILWLEPEQLAITVSGGEVELTGQVETKTDAELIPSFVRRVPGVVGVTSKLRWREENGHRRSRVAAGQNRS
jgi:CBS domain-containing protein